MPGAISYNIYRSDSVRGTGFDFAAPYDTITGDGVGKIIYADVGAYTDGLDHSWVIRAVGSGGENTTDSGEIAFKKLYSFFIGAGAGGDNNYFGLPYRSNITWGSDNGNSKALLLDMRAFGSPANGISSLNKFDQDSGTWVVQSPSPAPFKWALQPGDGYRAVCVVPMTYALVGSHDPAVVLNFRIGAGAGGDNNYVVLPYHFNNIYEAYANNSKALLFNIIVDGIPADGISSINRWDQNNGIWQAQTIPSVPKWVLAPGDAYRYVATVASMDWQCPVTTLGP